MEKEDYVYISELAIDSVIMVSKYLGLNTCYKIISKSHSESKGLEKMNRLVSICKKEKATDYINPIGGIEIYNKEDFINRGVELSFLKTDDISYNQFNDEFIPHLSIIDVMMFNSSEDIRKMLNKYTLI